MINSSLLWMLRIVVPLTIQSVVIYHCSDSISGVIGFSFYIIMYIILGAVLATVVIAEENGHIIIEQPWSTVMFYFDCTFMAMNISANCASYCLTCYGGCGSAKFWSGLAFVILISIMFEVLVKILIKIKNGKP
jgi:hypothetical protein